MRKKNISVPKLKEIFNKNIVTSPVYLNFKSLLKKHIKKNSFVVAVSGGPDSLALTALSKVYSNESKAKAYFVLIDHGIRNNSSSEALIVKKILKKNKIKLNIIKNNFKIKKSNTQSQARNIRYKLMAEFCKKNNVKFILTAHHSNDQIETFLIRLSRGSGVQGLSSMSSISQLNNKTKIFRPLLEVKKKDLVLIAKKIFGKVINDPSNKDKKYLRTRVRSLTKELEKSGIHHNQIIKSINNLSSTRDLLNNYILKVSKLCTIRKKNEIIINLNILLVESNEVQLKIISSAIKIFSKSYYPPRSKKIIFLLTKVANNKKVKSTLGGCIFLKSGNHLSIKKEV